MSRLAGLVALAAAPTLVASGAAAAQPSTQATAVGWSQVEPASSPTGRSSVAAAYHAGIEKTVLFGGRGVGAARETWVFDGETWSELGLERSPRARHGSSMAYDAARGEIVLFGGERARGERDFQKLGDTWVFDGEQWERRRPDVTPPPMSSMAMAYDSRRHEVVLFGGLSEDVEPSDETSVWDGSTWSQRHPETAPLGRYGHGMAYSRQRGQVVLMGGNHGVYGQNDTWLWDGTDWVEMETSRHMYVRDHPGMASLRGRVVLYGGTRYPRADGTTTWVLGRGDWQSRAAGANPGPRVWPALVHDEARDQLVLFGGTRPEVQLDDTWILRL